MKTQLLFVTIALFTISNLSYAQMKPVAIPEGGSNSGGMTEGGSNSGGLTEGGSNSGGLTEGGSNSGGADVPIKFEIDQRASAEKKAISYVHIARLNKTNSAELAIASYQQFYTEVLKPFEKPANNSWLYQHAFNMNALAKKLSALGSNSDLQMDLLDSSIVLVADFKVSPEFFTNRTSNKTASSEDVAALNQTASSQVSFLISSLFIGNTNILRYSPNEQNAILESFGKELAWDYAGQPGLAKRFAGLKDIETAQALRNELNSINALLK